MHFVNFSEYPQRNVTHLQRRHYKTRRSHYPVVGFGGFNFGNESESERQIVVFYSLECYHSHLTEDGPYRIFKTEEDGGISGCNVLSSVGKGTIQ